MADYTIVVARNGAERRVAEKVAETEMQEILLRHKDKAIQAYIPGTEATGLEYVCTLSWFKHCA